MHLTKQEMADLSKSIAAHIVAAGLPLKNESNDQLVELSCRETQADSRWTDVRAEFSQDPTNRWNSAAELTAKGDYSWDKIEDEETGDIYTTYTVTFNVRWSGISDEQARTELLQRLDIMRGVTELALKLQEKFGGKRTVLVRTKAEEAERIAKELAEEKRRKVQRLSEYPSKGLRAGGNARQLSREIFSGCEDGQYEVTHGDKTFRVTLRPGNASVRRLT